MRRIFICVPLLTVAACSGNDVKDTLGLTREAPDEYRVATHPPLSVPPAFNLLPPAAPGEMPAAQGTDKQAQSLLTGKPIEESNTFRLKPDAPVTPVITTKPTAKLTPEANFLQKAGANEANPNVRTIIEREKIAAMPAPEEETSWWNPTSWWGDKKSDPQVDAKAEADRLKKNQAEGKPVTEGETPDTSGGHDTGVLGNIFGY